MEVSTRDYYDILGCSKTSTQEELKRAYHKQARRFHPDKSTNSEISACKFHLIDEAWKVLQDPLLRKDYDARRKQLELNVESSLVYARLSPDELETSNDEDSMTYWCRCGSNYTIQKEYLQMKDTEIRIPCPGCTFAIVVET